MTDKNEKRYMVRVTKKELEALQRKRALGEWLQEEKDTLKEMGKKLLKKLKKNYFILMWRFMCILAAYMMLLIAVSSNPFSGAEVFAVPVVFIAGIAGLLLFGSGLFLPERSVIRMFCM